MPRAGQVLLVVAAVAVVVAVFLLVRPSDERTIETAPSETAAEPEAHGEEHQGSGQEGGDPKPAGPPIVEVVDGEPKGGVVEIEARRGDAVEFEVESNAPDEVHVHGYDLYERVDPDRTAVFEFDADLEGIYEVELHDAGSRIAELRVNP